MAFFSSRFRFLSKLGLAGTILAGVGVIHGLRFNTVAFAQAPANKPSVFDDASLKPSQPTANPAAEVPATPSAAPKPAIPVGTSPADPPIEVIPPTLTEYKAWAPGQVPQISAEQTWVYTTDENGLVVAKPTQVYRARTFLGAEASELARAEEAAAKIATEYHSLHNLGNNHPKRKELRDRLKASLTQAFSLRNKAHTTELESLKKRMETVEATMRRRAENKDKIIEQRIAQLLNEEGDLDWAPTQPVIRPTVLPNPNAAVLPKPTFPPHSDSRFSIPEVTSYAPVPVNPVPRSSNKLPPPKTSPDAEVARLEALIAEKNRELDDLRRAQSGLKRDNTKPSDPPISR